MEARQGSPVQTLMRFCVEVLRTRNQKREEFLKNEEGTNRFLSHFTDRVPLSPKEARGRIEAFVEELKRSEPLFDDEHEDFPEIVSIEGRNSPVEVVSNALSVLERVKCDVYDVETHAENRGHTGMPLVAMKPLLTLYCRINNWLFTIDAERNSDCEGGIYLSERFFNRCTTEEIDCHCDWRSQNSSSAVGDVLLDFLNNHDGLESYRREHFQTYLDLPRALEEAGYRVIQEESKSWTWLSLFANNRVLALSDAKDPEKKFYLIHTDKTLYAGEDSDMWQLYVGDQDDRKWYVEHGYISDDTHFSTGETAICIVDATTPKEIVARVNLFATVLRGEYGECIDGRWMNAKHLDERFREIRSSFETLNSTLRIELNPTAANHPIDPFVGLHVNYEARLDVFRYVTRGDFYHNTRLPYLSIHSYFVSDGRETRAQYVVVLRRPEKRYRSLDVAEEWEKDGAADRLEELIQSGDIPLTHTIRDQSSLHPIVQRHVENLLSQEDVMGIVEEWCHKGDIRYCLDQVTTHYQGVSLHLAYVGNIQ